MKLQKYQYIYTENMRIYLAKRYAVEIWDHIKLIFLNICAQNATQSYVEKIIGHSQKTPSRKFHKMLNVLEKMAVHLLKIDLDELTQLYPRL